MPAKKEQVVISGISGRFPECLNIQQFKERILAGDNLVTHDGVRWPVGKFDRLMTTTTTTTTTTTIIFFL